MESCGPGMNVRVSKCALGGLDPAQDLKLSDSTCSPEITNIENVETDGYYDLRIPYEGCGTSFNVSFTVELFLDKNTDIFLTYA